jgi:DNA polymerase bacteriophage-type
MKLHIDFETRSAIELQDVGIDNYSRHPSTDVWCLGYALNDEEPRIWTPLFDDLPFSLTDSIVFAHNTAFELAIWNHIMVPRYNWPALKVSNVRCTMAMAYAMALPGSLEKAAAAVGIPQQKDLSGHRLMMQMARPRGFDAAGQPVWWDDSVKLHALYEYCKQDVRVERALEQRLLPLSDAEQKLWEVDYAVNQRGVFLDRPAIQTAITLVQTEADRLNRDLRHVTGNVVGFTSEVARLTNWIRSRGVAIDGLAKAAVLDALEMDDLPSDARSALLIRQEAGKTSTAKLQTMLNACSADGRVKYTMQYHGAGTGRWAGRRIQPHNLPRPTLSRAEVESILDLLPTVQTDVAIRQIELLYGQPLSVISDCLRGMICAAPGNELIAGDYSNIEGRGIAWLAGEEWKLDAFKKQDAKEGPEIYILAAAKIYHRDPAIFNKKSPERQIGKVAELALGYQGGVGAFTKMAKTSGVKVSEAEATVIRDEWRAAHPRIVQYWTDLETVCAWAVSHPGSKAITGPLGRRITFLVKGSFLFCLLPSGRVLTYPYPKLKPMETPWGELKEQVHYMTVDGLSGKWVETHTYGGKLSENITQAICRDLLAFSILECEAEGFPVVLHVHDEVVVELPLSKASEKEQDVYRVMGRTPAWAKGLPVVIEGWRGRRYRK